MSPRWRRAKHSRPPAEWSDEQINRQLTVAYYSADNPHRVMPPTTFRAAVVYHQDPDLLPPEMVERAGSEYPEGFIPWVLFMFEGPLHGELKIGWSSHADESAARAAGRAWVGADGLDCPLYQLPEQVMPLLRHTIRFFPEPESTPAPGRQPPGG
jgi:hypothetical protein